jgi:hypothetical protein
MAPIDPYGWRGPAGDPWSGDAGDLWLSGAPRYPDVVAPTVDIGAAQAAEDPSDITVSWSGRAPAEYDIEVVVDDAPPSPWLQRMGAGSAHFQAASGHVYWFLGSAHTDLGWTAAGASRAVDLQAASFPP